MIPTTKRSERLRISFMIFAVMSLMGHACKAECYGRNVGERQKRFKIVEGEVEDTKTGLIWKRCSLGAEWNGKDGCAGQVSYLGLDEAIAAATDGWRVPTGAELETIVDVGCGAPVVDPSVFADIKQDDEGHAKYWSTSPYGVASLYWNFDFVDGHPDANSRGVRLSVRLVRTKR